jgi:hypothetical protein
LGVEVLEGAALRGISTQRDSTKVDSLKEDFPEAVSGAVFGNDLLGSADR